MQNKYTKFPTNTHAGILEKKNRESGMDIISQFSTIYFRKKQTNIVSLH
jgi:hypothetical protein